VSSSFDWRLTRDAITRARAFSPAGHGLHHCRFEWDQNQIDPNIFGIQLASPITWPNFSVEPVVYECKFLPKGGHEVHIKLNCDEDVPASRDGHALRGVTPHAPIRA
jgi:hypothetical protein